MNFGGTTHVGPDEFVNIADLSNKNDDERSGINYDNVVDINNQEPANSDYQEDRGMTFGGTSSLDTNEDETTDNNPDDNDNQISNNDDTTTTNSDNGDNDVTTTTDNDGNDNDTTTTDDGNDNDTTTTNDGNDNDTTISDNNDNDTKTSDNNDGDLTTTNESNTIQENTEQQDTNTKDCVTIGDGKKIKISINYKPMQKLIVKIQNIKMIVDVLFLFKKSLLLFYYFRLYI